ncbi:MAG: hypothetical protein A2V67_12625 [Deltaproteobacteria bacterium RBG_13_61_14]|nr:MAG: hypothetical protein A2V67_12625 [Deltaproteobacteria bacterium RBG_13_61_14]
MWPFTKKPKQPEPKIEEEKPLLEFEVKVTVDPETVAPPMEPKEPDQPEMKPEPLKKTQWKCPTCKQAFPGRATRSRFKCPHCRNWVYFLGDNLVTMEDHGRLAEKYYQDRYRGRLRETMKEELAKMGLTEEKLKRRENELLAKMGVQPQKIFVILSVFNETILKVKNLNEKCERYLSLADILRKGGEDTFHILQIAVKAKLAALRKDGFINVSIIASGMCERCKKVDGKVLSIEQALKTMPIPIRECQNRGEDENYGYCICEYYPEHDDEYWKNQP